MNKACSLPQWLSAGFGSTDQSKPEWFQAIQKKHWQDFKTNGMPTKKNERWKYIDANVLQQGQFFLAPVAISDCEDLTQVIQQHALSGCNLVVIIDGQLSLMHTKILDSALTVCKMEEAFQSYPQQMQTFFLQTFSSRDYPMASLNLSLSEQGIFIHLPKEISSQRPLQILTIAKTANLVSFPQIYLWLENDSELAIIEEQLSFTNEPYFANKLTHLHLSPAAKLNYITLQNQNVQAVYLNQTFLNQRQYSDAQFTTVSVGGNLARDELVATLIEEGARCSTYGFAKLSQHSQCIDQHVEILHSAPFSSSEMVYKTILDQCSTSIFNGKVTVAKAAAQINAQQTNHNIVLSDRAEVYTKPELEIYADDVQCKHGATIGQLDEEALFYLRSRGIAEDQAKSILLQGFAQVVLDRIPEAIRQKAKQMAAL